FASAGRLARMATDPKIVLNSPSTLFPYIRGQKPGGKRMYEAPDRYKRLISARLPGGESAGLAAREAESESSPLRDVQLISRAQLAPFFAAAHIIAALMMAASLWGSKDATWLLPWAAAVAVVNLGAM